MLHASVTTLGCTASRCRSSAPQLRCHGRIRSRKGTQKRYRCPHCGRTRSASSGTVYHRLHHSKAKFDQAVTLSVEGVSQAAIARALGVAASTVRRWLKKAAQAATTFSDLHIRHLSPVELQADELKTFAGSRKNTKWVHTSMSVWSRLWATLHVGQRRLRDVEVHYRDLRSRVSMFHEPPLWPSAEPLRCYAYFLRPHGSLRFGRRTRTLAQQAGLATRRLTRRDVVFVPLDRSRLLRVERLVERVEKLGADGRRAIHA